MTSQRQILVVHGALGSAAQMEPVAQALGAVGMVHNIELPGHGSTPLPSGAQFSIQSFVDALDASIRERATRPASRTGSVRPLIFGYSMGGYLALALEAQRPGTFGGIVTLGTKFAWTPALALRELSRLDANVIREKIPKFADVLEQRHANAGGWKLVLERTGALLVELGDKPLLTRESLAAVEIPSCVAVGELDDTVSSEEAAEYAAFMPAGLTHVIAGAPHPIERIPVSEIVALVRGTVDKKGE